MSQEGRTFFVLQPINYTEPVHTRLGNLTWLPGEGGLHPVGCMPPVCQPYVLQWPPLHINIGGEKVLK